MDQSKFWLQSKTILGAILMTIVTFAPIIGLNFTADDAALVTEQVDKIVQAISIALVVWGRVTASKALSVKVNTDTLNSPWFVSVMLGVMLLAGCVTSANLEGKTTLEKAQISYAAAESQIAIYASLPPCERGVIGLCSRLDIVEKLTTYSAQVKTYLDLAIAASAAADAEAEEAALRDAQNALKTLLTIYAIQALTKA